MSNPKNFLIEATTPRELLEGFATLELRVVGIVAQRADGQVQIAWSGADMSYLYFMHRLFGRALDDAFDKQAGKFRTDERSATSRANSGTDKN